MTDSGDALTATGSGVRKKDADLEAHLNACLLLDRYNLLNPVLVARKKTVKSADADDDMDDYYDRTRRVNPPSANGVETYTSLSLRRTQIMHELDTLCSSGSLDDAVTTEHDQDEFEAYMASVESSLHAQRLADAQCRRIELQAVRFVFIVVMMVAV
jgi:hypothetical protein